MAKKDSWFSHLALEVPRENTSNEWCESVTDEDPFGSFLLISTPFYRNNVVSRKIRVKNLNILIAQNSTK